MVSSGLLSLSLAARASATILFATSYNDHAVTSLNLQGSTLSVVGKNLDCGSEPTWLTLDKASSRLFCLNEGWGGAASITSYKTKKDGTLETKDVLPVLKSPVSSTLYAGGKGLAVAHYDTSTFSTFNVDDLSNLGLTQNVTYTLAAPGPVPDRQEAPHLHDAILDPTKKFLLSPDLGADLIRVFKIDSALAWTASTPVKAVPGSGPRHGAFAVVGKKTFFYTVNELDNTITGYSVAYKTSGLDFTQLFHFSSNGPNAKVPAGTKAAELEVSPDQRFVLISSRGQNSLSIPAFNGSATTIPSDPIVSFSINQKTGVLSLVQIAPAGGRNPRGFSLNAAGDLVASALQDDNRVVVYKRDVATGKLGDVVAFATVGAGENNGPNYVLFNE